MKKSAIKSPQKNGEIKQQNVNHTATWDICQFLKEAHALIAFQCQVALIDLSGNYSILQTCSFKH